MAELEIYAAMQPAHFYADKSTEDALGRERLQRFMPWRSWTWRAAPGTTP